MAKAMPTKSRRNESPEWPTDPLTYAAVIVLLVASAMIACWLPADRARRVDPMVALRNE